MRGAFRVEAQPKPKQRLRAKKKQGLAKASVTDVLDKAATVRLSAKLKASGASSSGGTRVLSQALDAKRSTVSLKPNKRTKIRLRFSKSARKKIRAALSNGGAWKVIVTAAATDGYENTSKAKTRFRLSG